MERSRSLPLKGFYILYIVSNFPVCMSTKFDTVYETPSTHPPAITITITVNRFVNLNFGIEKPKCKTFLTFHHVRQKV